MIEYLYFVCILSLLLVYAHNYVMMGAVTGVELPPDKMHLFPCVHYGLRKIPLGIETLLFAVMTEYIFHLFSQILEC